jgi:hypothetical protein
VRKYDAHWYYSPLHTGERSSALGPDGQVAEYLTLKYDAVYGDVPGLVKDEPMGSADGAISGACLLRGSLQVHIHSAFFRFG